jgi:hypothetical protein
VVVVIMDWEPMLFVLLGQALSIETRRIVGTAVRKRLIFK